MERSAERLRRFKYDFRSTSEFNDGVHGEVSEVEEMTVEQARALGPDSDGDGVDDFQDNCRAIPNPGQADRDADEAGDACQAGGYPLPRGGPGPTQRADTTPPTVSSPSVTNRVFRVGRSRATVTATDAARNRSAPRRASFRVVR